MRHLDLHVPTAEINKTSEPRIPLSQQEHPDLSPSLERYMETLVLKCLSDRLAGTVGSLLWNTPPTPNPRPGFSMTLLQHILDAESRCYGEVLLVLLLDLLSQDLGR